MEYVYEVTRTFEVDAAHSLRLSYESKCARVHGHRWKITVHLRSNELDENGMVMDFAKIKAAVIDLIDHKNINDVVDFNPTAELLARWILDTFPLATQVSVEEQPGSLATCTKLTGETYVELD